MFSSEHRDSSGMEQGISLFEGDFWRAQQEAPGCFFFSAVLRYPLIFDPSVKKSQYKGSCVCAFSVFSLHSSLGHQSTDWGEGDQPADAAGSWLQPGTSWFAGAPYVSCVLSQCPIGSALCTNVGALILFFSLGNKHRQLGKTMVHRCGQGKSSWLGVWFL